MGNSVSLEDELINLRLTSKAMVRSSEKCQKNAKAASAKVKKAIQQNNPDGARIYAQDAIREKNQALNCLRLASRIDAVSSRLDTAVRMNQLTISMGGVVKGMSKGLQAMDIDKLTRTMEKFEHQFDEWDDCYNNTS
jgi:charged multivesicular body protein 1